MIGSFKHRGLKRLYERDDHRGIRADLVQTVIEILTVLDRAATPNELDLPGYRLPAQRQFERALVSHCAGDLAHRLPLRRRGCF
jgi:plasmid maintenance system killer protein